MTLKDGRSTPAQTISASNAGLCADCAHARQVTTDRASSFLQCELSFTDPRFPKYPRLPVRTCPGHKKQQGIPAGT